MRKSFLVLILAVTACGGSKVSKQKAAAIIEASTSFKSSKLVYLPRVVAIPAEAIPASTATREGEALTITEIASVDPVIAVLRARDQVTIEDFVSAVQSSIVLPPPPKTDQDSSAKDTTKKSPLDSAKAHNDSVKAANDTTKPANDSTKHRIAKPVLRLDEPRTSPPPAPPLAQAWIHTLRITPRPKLKTSELTPDDGDDNPESPRAQYAAKSVGRTPGWTLSVGTRDFMRILEVAPYTPARGEPQGEMRVDFLWRWKSTKSGSPFDMESAEYESLPAEVRQAALTGAVALDTSTPHWSRATLARDGTGWKVTSVDWGYGDDKPHDRW